MASGSELSLCVDAYEKLKAEGLKARVVSMPCWELFEQQDAAYKANVLPQNVTARVSVEMGSTFGWERYVGAKGKIDRKSTRLNSSHGYISYAVFCLKKKK